MTGGSLIGKDANRIGERGEADPIASAVQEFCSTRWCVCTFPDRTSLQRPCDLMCSNDLKIEEIGYLFDIRAPVVAADDPPDLERHRV